MIRLFIPKKIKHNMTTSLVSLLNAIGYLLLSLILFTVSFKFTEDATWLDSIWLSYVSATTLGYGDIYALTTAGRVCTVIFGTFGLVMLGMLYQKHLNI